MKTPKFLFILIGCGAFIYRLSFADAPAPARAHEAESRSKQTGTSSHDGKEPLAKSPGETLAGSHAADLSDLSEKPVRLMGPKSNAKHKAIAKAPKQPLTVKKAIVAKQTNHNQTKDATGKTSAIRAPAVNKTAVAGEDVLAKKTTEKQLSLPGASRLGDPVTASSPTVRGRPPRLATLGGLSSHARTTAMISGTGMKPKY